jgi:YidC/Oxa1 family membrane protein insertase
VTRRPREPAGRAVLTAGDENPYYAEFGWVTAAGGPAVPGSDTVWTADKQRLSPGEDVTLTWDNGAGLIFRRTLAVDAKYMFTVRQSVENTTGAPVALYPYGLVSRTGLPQTAGYFILHEGLIGFVGEEGLQEIDYADLEDAPAITPPKSATAGWASPTNIGAPPWCRRARARSSPALHAVRPAPSRPSRPTTSATP